MCTLSWQYETHIGKKGNTISMHADGDLHENVFDTYIDEFMHKYRKYENIKEAKKLDFINNFHIRDDLRERANNNTKKEWSIIIHTSFNGKIEYPGHIGNNPKKILT